jgi:hypothetical protein
MLGKSLSKKIGQECHFIQIVCLYTFQILGVLRGLKTQMEIN